MDKRILLIISLLICAYLSHAQFAPDIVWREYADSSFIVIFPAGYESEALYTLRTAKAVHSKLNGFWNSEPRGLLRIVLYDGMDSANGSASFFPFNHIVIHLYHPPPDSTIGSCRDWIRFALTHEMSHIYNFASASPGIDGLRKIFGRNPLLYPMTHTPVWLIEGAAVFAESKYNPGGRLNSPDYDIILQAMADGGELPSYRDIYGDPTFWPGPRAKYLFGGSFLRYLALTYGERSIPAFIQYYTRHLVSISSAYRFKKFFGKPLSLLWEEYLQSISGGGQPLPAAVQPLTTDGMNKHFPVHTDSGDILFVQRDYQTFPGLWILDRDSGESRRILEQSGINAVQSVINDQTLYFSAADRFKTYYRFSDLYSYHLPSRRLTRLTRGKRVYSPALSGDVMYCLRREKSRSYIARLSLDTGEIEDISPGFSAMQYLSVSPDGRFLAVSLKKRGKPWQIGLLELEKESLTLLNSGPLKCYYPQWRDSNELIFICEHNYRYRVASYVLGSSRGCVYTAAGLPSMKYVTPGTGRESVVSVMFDANGLNLTGLNLNRLDTLPLPLKREPVNRPQPSFQRSIEASRPYRPLRDLAPTFWGFTYRYGGNDIQPGLYTSGNDAIGTHAYTLELFYGTRTSSWNIRSHYRFNGLQPDLNFNAYRVTNLNRDLNGHEYTTRITRVDLTGLFPLLVTNRFSVKLYGDIHTINVLEKGMESELLAENTLNGFTVGLLVNSAKTYYDSFSRTDGLSLAVSFSKNLRRLGSDFNLSIAAMEYKHYISLFRPNVLALRLGFSKSWGDGSRLIHMGGASSQQPFHIAGGNMFNLMRGFPSGFFTGTGGYILNLEYRISIAKMEKSIFISRSIERFFLTLFADLGNLWRLRERLDPALSLGVEFCAVVHLGTPVTFSAGAAIGRNPYHPATVYFRIGHSF